MSNFFPVFAELDCSLAKVLYLVAIVSSKNNISPDECSQFKKYALASEDNDTLDKLVDLFEETHCLRVVILQLRLFVAAAQWLNDGLTAPPTTSVPLREDHYTEEQLSPATTLSDLSFFTFMPEESIDEA